MKLRSIIWMVILVSTLVLGLVGCSSDLLTGPDTQNFSEQGVPAAQINFVQWRPDVAERIKSIEGPMSLAKIGYDEKVISKFEGGVVGGDCTFGCYVEIPPHAFQEDERTIIAQVATNDEACAGIDFLPNQTFSKDVKVTVSLEYLNIDKNADLSDFKTYWYNETSGLWIEVPNPVIDLEEGSVSVWVNHFTRYGWGL